MQQKCLQFHTSKSFHETLKILEKEKLEIIFQSTSCRISFTELTMEEKISWIEEREKDMTRCDEFLKNHSGKFDSFFESMMDFRKQSKELVNLHKSSPTSYKTSEKYEQFIKARDKLRGKWDFLALYDIWVDHLRFSRSIVSCSCIIAKKGT